VNSACVDLSTLAIVSGVNADDMALDSTSIYWVDGVGGTVNVVPKTGGAATVLATGQAKPIHLALDVQYVYYSAILGGAVMRVPKAGGGAPSVVVPAAEPNDLVVDGQNVYWLSQLDGNVRSAPKAGGGAATTIFTPSGWASPVRQLRANTQSLFFLGGPPGNEDIVNQITKTGSPVATFHGVLDQFITNYYVDDTYVYHDMADLGGDFWVQIEPLAGGTGLGIWKQMTQGPLTADGTHVFAYGAAGSEVGVRELSLCANLHAPPVVDLPAAPKLMVDDTTYIYWFDGTRISRIAK
jgi:hypothetical protein